MNDERDDAQGRAATPTPGWSAGSAAAPYGQVHHGQAPSAQTSYGQQAYGQQAHGQQTYGPPGYGQAPYGQAPYGPPGYGPAPFGQSPYPPAQPARPGTVITAAVLGLVHGALGLLTTAGLLVGGALFDDLVSALAEADPSLDGGVSSSEVDSVRAGFLLLGVLALAWTVAMVWGSVLALRGRSRVLLIVGSSIAVAASGFVALFGVIGLATEPSEDGAMPAAVLLLLLFLAALAMLVLICLRSSGQFFAAHRQRRSLSRY